MADEKKMTVNEALGVFTPFKNIFRAAERLEEACLVVANLEGDVARLNEEKKKAENEYEIAARELAGIQKKVKEADDDAFKRMKAHQAEIEDERVGLVKFKAKCAKETDEFREVHEKTRQKIKEDTDALEAKRGNLARQVREMEHPPGEPEGSFQARVEP